MNSKAAELGFEDLPQKLQAIRDEIRTEYLQEHEKPWIVGFSGGKDSTLLLQLIFEVLLDLPPTRRMRRSVHVLSNDTLVESPVFQTFANSILKRVSEAAAGLRLPITTVQTSPDPNNTFWANLIGRGYPAPNRLFRWCTDRMKIQPTTRYIHEQASRSGEVILLLGVRRSESTNRAKHAKRYDNGGRLNRHNDIQACMVFRPILELDTDEVWAALSTTEPPWGGTHDDIVALYRNALGGECPVVMDKSDAPSCGTSSARFGCWTCTVVEKDRSIHGFIDSGLTDLTPLAGFRDWLKEFSRDPRNRMTERRNGNEGLGPFTLEGRQIILAELRSVEAKVGYRLVSDAEIATIEQIWRDDGSLIAHNRAKRVLKLFGEP